MHHNAAVRLRTTSLAGSSVVLEPMSAEHVASIAAAAAEDRSTYGYTQVPDGLDDTARYVRALLDDADAGLVGPFVQRRASDGSVVGCTRYMSPAWPLGRDDPDEIEVGGTWLSAGAQRTGINTEAKLLLLSYAFEVWCVQRVAICTDARNEQSRRAIERLGATFEGVLRRHRLSTRPGDVGILRDTATYSVIADEWEPLKDRLTARSSRFA
jgi:RimJ/RimL family protein N-acetyltransferase